MDWNLFLGVISFVVIPDQVLNHVISPGKCPKMEVKQNFDIKKYMGTWYGYASFGTESTQGRGKCVTARYKYNTTAKQVDVYNWQIPSPGYRGSINGFAVPLNRKIKEGKLKVTFQVSENRTKTFPLMVLDTDYKKWAVVYFCRDLLHHHETSGWILTRVQNLDSSKDKVTVEAEVAEVLKKANLDRTILTNGPKWTNITNSLRILDSLQSLSNSLETRVNTLALEGPTNFNILRQCMGDQHLDLLLKKGVFPYATKLQEHHLQPKPTFFNDLT